MILTTLLSRLVSWGKSQTKTGIKSKSGYVTRSSARIENDSQSNLFGSPIFPLFLARPQKKFNTKHFSQTQSPWCDVFHRNTRIISRVPVTIYFDRGARAIYKSINTQNQPRRDVINWIWKMDFLGHLATHPQSCNPISKVLIFATQERK